jgi:rhamnose transport system ATP-binding protein
MMVGREVDAIYPKRGVPLGEVALELRNLTSRAAGVHGVSLEIRSGEILGLAGLVGSGRTELAEVIFGLAPADSGEILLRGFPVKIGSPGDAMRRKMGYVPEDRRRHGVVLPMPISSNISLANLDRISRHGLIDNAAENSLTRTYVDRLAVKTTSIFGQAGSLSGGNQQKVALARWLAIEPEVLILDEPTQGVDVGSKSEIHRLIVDLAAHGLAILLISSEMPEVLGMSDRIGVMRSGRLAAVFERSEATQEKLLAVALGHGASHAA